MSLLMFETRVGRQCGPSSCCSRESIEDARKTAEVVGVPHTVVDAREEFMERVIAPFVEAYAKGRTPNPCVLCNRHIKFPVLLREAEARGAGFIATGHYARAERGEGGRVLLMKGADAAKDQSYVLYALRREELDRLVLPLGGLTKKQVRERAREAGLPVFGRPESQEICFVAEGKYAEFVSALEPAACRPGPVVDEAGAEVGTHKGICGLTVGQRRGLGVASGRPLYVTAIDAGKNTVHVGPKEAAMVREFHASDLNWLVEVRGGFRALVKVRSTMEARPAAITPVAADRVHVVFDEPQFAPAPGQSAVFYDGETVLGGGVIEQLPPVHAGCM
jgi:tRNA-specific 2-thiouridylase